MVLFFILLQLECLENRIPAECSIIHQILYLANFCLKVLCHLKIEKICVVNIQYLYFLNFWRGFWGSFSMFFPECGHIDNFALRVVSFSRYVQLKGFFSDEKNSDEI